MPGNSVFLQTFLEPFVGSWLYKDSAMWTAVGFLGAAIFGSRFVLQWLQSEKEKKLVVPWYFWHLSFWGSVLNLLYFMHLDKAPLILGNCFLPFLYGRNIFFLRASGERGRGRLVFAAVAALTLAGFGVSAFMGNPSGGHSRESRVQAELKDVELALKSFHTEYGALPTGDTRRIVRALKDDNKNKVRFLDPADRELSAQGDLLDPWDHPYHIFVSGKTFLIRCAGPNGTFDDGTDEKRDDILIESSVP